MACFQRDVVVKRATALAYDHITLKTRHPVRSGKLSNVESRHNRLTATIGVLDAKVQKVGQKKKKKEEEEEHPPDDHYKRPPARDVIVTSSDEDEPQSRVKRLAVHPFYWETRLWPNGEVPYHIASHYTQTERNVILSAMKAFHKETCIKFRQRTKADKYYLSVNKYYELEKCFSYIGRQTGNLFKTAEGAVETRMKLAPQCLMYNGRGTVMHELMHILGFYHEHQRDDRDKRIGGNSKHYNFNIRSRKITYYMGSYDPESIMHYNFPGVPSRKRDYFSPTDIFRINALYKCHLKGRKLSYPSQMKSTEELTSEEQKALDLNELRRRRRIRKL
ncbi:unnamed protein product [Caenorhabditis auriculariae]|uniref:Metalloendopeptidase n=1 Tax=Caenorhabditis auriculariae TaxID=2777116 RepID=A0A8S1H3J1_9PELO|nr:unnamed protein product [Caenorhabditis auriculariae]